MISFVVIGKNEGWKLSLCFNSILRSAQENEITNYEILYIDAQSSDDSIEKAKKIPGIRIFSLTRECNAAIARNVGGKEAKGEVLFFLDGDMELQPDFIPAVFNVNGELIHSFISGINCHYFYDNQWNFLYKKNLPTIQTNVFQKTTGGFFIIEKKLWTAMNGMDTRLTVNEDLDFGLRLSKEGLFPLRIARVGVVHYTIDNMKSNRIWKRLLLYKYPAVLARKHLVTNKQYWSILFRTKYSAIALFVALILQFVFPVSIMGYLFVLMVRVLKHGAIKNFRVFPYYLCRDLLFVGSFFLFFPSQPEINYKEV